MIVPMFKYSFLVFHKEYKDFLHDLQNIGVLHIAKKSMTKNTDSLKEYNKQLSLINSTIQFLESRNHIQSDVKSEMSGVEVLNDIIQKKSNLEQLETELESLSKEYIKSKPWGNFSSEIIEKLKLHDLQIRYFISSKKAFQKLEGGELAIEKISENDNKVYFLLFQHGNGTANIDAIEVDSPKNSCNQISEKIKTIEKEIEKLNNCFDAYSGNSIPLLSAYKQELTNLLQFEKAIQNTSAELGDKLMILEGWVPKPMNDNIERYLKKRKALFIKSKPTPQDKIPILLKNNRFGKLFEPIGSMFSLPDYSELDLTVFFAPFFMMFFGFCLGDAGYGLLFVIGAGLYRFKATAEVKPYLSLIQFLGLATIIFGTISGTFFGINLIEAEVSWIENYKSFFLNPDKMFNLALILGGVQIIFGLFIRAANQIKQYGFNYSLATWGWLTILLGCILYVVLLNAEIIPSNKTVVYIILSVGAFFILFFSDPKISMFARIGKGVWDIYSTITGIFGDLLSYIRLFALGLSSAILGFVINDIGMQILGSSKILGPVFFVIFLIIGHTLNILISSLGSFVHPMRLTFVEFYKSAGFIGGGEEYKPFKKSEIRS